MHGSSLLRRTIEFDLVVVFFSFARCLSSHKKVSIRKEIETGSEYHQIEPNRTEPNRIESNRTEPYHHSGQIWYPIQIGRDGGGWSFLFLRNKTIGKEQTKERMDNIANESLAPLLHHNQLLQRQTNRQRNRVGFGDSISMHPEGPTHTTNHLGFCPRCLPFLF